MPKARPAVRYKHIAFVASDVPEAQRARRRLTRLYGDARPETADVVVALGGDGLMLTTLQRFMNSGKPIYGMHRGTVGFLMNEYSERALVRRLVAAHVTIEVLEAGKRPVAAVADHDEVRSVRSVDISMDHSIAMHMLFDPDHSLDERILSEQFVHSG